MTSLTVEGKIAQAVSGKHIKAKAPAIPLTKCTFALVDVE